MEKQDAISNKENMVAFIFASMVIGIIVIHLASPIVFHWITGFKFY